MLSLHGRRAFVVCSGPSINKLDLSLLGGEFTLGINRAFEFLTPSALYSMDEPFYSDLVSGEYDKFSGKPLSDMWKALTCPKFHIFYNNIQFGYGVIRVKRCYSAEIKYSLEDGIYTGLCSAFGGIMLLVALGCRDIYLVGCDMKFSERTHAHSGYPKQQELSIERAKIETYRKDFKEWAPKFREAGVSVTNLVADSGDSALEGYEEKKYLDMFSRF